MARYKFDEFNNIAEKEDMQVIVISGSHNIFVDMLVDKIKQRKDVNSGMTPLKLTGNTLTEEFETSDFGDMTLDLETFFSVCSSMSPMGKWICKANYDFATKKERDKIKAYIKKPSPYAMLIVTVAEYKNIRELRAVRALDNSRVSHIIDIQYPRKAILAQLVTQMFKDKGYNVGEQSIQIFIMRMGSAYDEYKDTINLICDRLKSLTSDIDLEEKALNDKEEHKRNINVNIKDFKEAMQGIDFFVIDDFLLEIIKPLHSSKVVKRRKMYKILNALLDECSAKDICGRLKYKVEELLYYRAYINNGVIPVKIRYNADKIKERLPENSKLRKATSLSFKRNAYIASKTSIEDWYFMYSLLNRNSFMDSDDKYMATLYAIMDRTAVSNDRLMNNMRVKNTLDEGLADLNGILMSPWWQSLKQVER